MMLASMAEREQLRTLSACKDTTFPRDYRRIPQKIVNCQLSNIRLSQYVKDRASRMQWSSLQLLRRSRFSSVSSKNDLASGNANEFAISRALSSSRQSLKDRFCERVERRLTMGRALLSDGSDMAMPVPTDGIVLARICVICSKNDVSIRSGVLTAHRCTGSC